MASEPEKPFVNELSIGTLVGASPMVRPNGPAFRIAILGDFSGRANRGERASAEQIAALRPRRIDFDSLDQTLAEMNPRLHLPVAGGRSTLDLQFQSLSDFHADHLFDAIPLIDSVEGIGRGIRRSLEKSAALFTKWVDSPMLNPPATPPSGITIPVVDQYSDFRTLPSRPAVTTTAGTVDPGQLLEPLCAPYVRPVIRTSPVSPEKLAAAAREATNGLVREFLHHPDFQTVEGAWQELEWLLRRTSRSSNIEVVLFDISAEEFAADLSADCEIHETGLYRLLVDKTAEGINPEPWSVIVGRYQFDFSSVHAQLLGRIAKIALRLNAPFLSGFTNKLLDPDLKIKDKALVAAWTQLRSLPEASYIGLGLPGFLLRMPYGKTGKSVEKFPFEEFSPRSGSRGFLWGNAGTFCAAILAAAYMRNHNFQFDPNSNRVLDRISVFALQLPNGDSITFCSEKQFAASTAQQAGALGLIPLQAIRGRDSITASEIRSLNLKSPVLCGPWSPGPRTAGTPEQAAPTISAAAATVSAAVTPAASTVAPKDNSGLDPELAALLGEISTTTPLPAGNAAANAAGGLDPELAALLGEISSPPLPTASNDAAKDAGGLDPELAALLGEISPPAPAPTSSGASADNDGLDPELAALLKG